MSFDEYASDYDAQLEMGLTLSGEGKNYFARGRLDLVRGIFEAGDFHPRRIIEFGCGVGTSTALIREFWPGSDVVGLDSSEASLRMARERLGTENIRFMTPVQYRRLGGPPADWVFCNGVLHHVPPPDRMTVLRLIRELLHDSGVFTVFENNPFNPGTRWVMKRIPFDHDAKMINPYRLEKMLAAVGFGRVTSRFLFVFPRMLSVLRPAEPYLARLPIGAQYGIIAFCQRS